MKQHPTKTALTAATKKMLSQVRKQLRLNYPELPEPSENQILTIHAEKIEKVNKSRKLEKTTV